MEKTIFIQYKPFGADVALSIPLRYQIDEEEDVTKINCVVDLALNQLPWWLRPYKFTVRARYDSGICSPLMDEASNPYTLDAALFIDKAQEEIFTLERRKGTQLNLG